MSNRYQTLVNHLLAYDLPFCEAVVESVQIKKDTIKVHLVVEGEAALHALADAAGGTVLLVVDSSKPAGGDVQQDDLFAPGQEDDENPPSAPPAAFDPNLDMPPDDDLSRYKNPIAEENEDGFFNETLDAEDKPPLG